MMGSVVGVLLGRINNMYRCLLRSFSLDLLAFYVVRSKLLTVVFMVVQCSLRCMCGIYYHMCRMVMNV